MYVIKKRYNDKDTANLAAKLLAQGQTARIEEHYNRITVDVYHIKRYISRTNFYWE